MVVCGPLAPSSGLGEGLGDGLGAGLGEGPGDGLGDGLGEGLGDGDGEGEGLGDGDGEGEGLGDGDGAAMQRLDLLLLVHWEILANLFLAAFAFARLFDPHALVQNEWAAGTAARAAWRTDGTTMLAAIMRARTPATFARLELCGVTTRGRSIELLPMEGS